MKKRVLLSSVLTIALCLCLIAGSTFALFEKKAEVNIVATAGKLDVTATIEDGKVFTQSAGDTVEFGRDGGFANGGFAQVDADSKQITVSGMTPGDALKFNVDVTNKSNIKTQYRVVWSSTAPADPVTTDLASALKVQVFVKEEELNMADKESAYYEAPAATTADGEVVTTFTVIVTFPNDADDDTLPDNDTFQGAVANLNFIVEAVQDNGVPETTTP